MGWAAVGGFIVVFVIQNHSDLPDAWRSVLRAHKGWLGLCAIAMVVWLFNLSRLHSTAQRAAGLRVARFDLLRPAITGNSLNLVTKSGGMAGLSVFLAEAARRGKPRGPVIAAYAFAQALGEVAFALTLAVALGLIWVDGRLSHAEIVAACVFVVYLTVRLGLLVAAVRSRESVRRLHATPTRIIATIRHRPAPTVDHSAADELFDAMLLVRRQPRRAFPVAVHAIALEAIGVVELWAAAAAVGASTSLLVAFIGYAVSVLFTIVGFLPGGIGFVEISLGAVLTSYGASIATATAAVVVYRAAELWLPLIIGFALARVRRPAKVATA
jgi:uncharacterized protein (TIRG00374 family)